MFLSVVFGPVGREHTLVGVQALECRRTRHGHDHAHGCDVDARLIEELGRAPEDSDVVLIESEHDAQVDGHAVAVKVRDDAVVVVDAVVRLVRCVETVLRDRLETEEQRLATASRR